MGNYPLEKMKNIVPSDRLFFNEPMSAHTSFKIGGPADAFIYAEETEIINSVFDFADENGIPVTVIGNGTNLLVSDAGIEGIVLAIKSINQSYVFTPDSEIEEGVFVNVSAGTLLSSFAKTAAKAGFSGTEPLAGIPGSVGGAVAMNAGAYGGEIKDIIYSAQVLDKEHNIITLSAEELELEYRNSAVLKKGYIVLSARFFLKRGNAEESLAKIADFNGRRRDKQPLEYPSAGSTFKRPTGYFAGKLIEDAGLRGFSVGGAQVSEKHCGFVINKGGADCKEVCKLIEEVKRRVFENSGVTLEPEVRILGRKM